ncbi:NAD(P)-binding protein [Phlegmacium glaucopus]|nr:NAD(P)-binding protein [Phlegmacium glaucopus]
MTILVTGGTGGTGLILARLLKERNHSFLVTSRSGTAPSPYKAVKFDWFDDKTFGNPFKADSSIDRVYLVFMPAVVDQLTIAKPFIDLAISKGVKRFVFLSASQVEIGSPAMGKIHKYLLDVKVDYTVLRPTWFMENFGTDYCPSIRRQNEVFGVAKDGRVPFVSVEDIAQAAYDALVSKISPNKDYYIFGPELFSYDQAAELLTGILGRKIMYRRISVDEAKKTFIGLGMDPEYVEWVVHLESDLAKGVEEDAFKFADKNKKVVGRHTLSEYFEANKDIWVKE